MKMEICPGPCNVHEIFMATALVLWWQCIPETFISKLWISMGLSLEMTVTPDDMNCMSSVKVLFQVELDNNLKTTWIA